jgi:hypothetical protein
MYKQKTGLPVLFLLVSFLLIYPACEKGEFEEACDKTKMTTMDKDFTLYLQVNYKDGVPFDGRVTLRIYKKYCEGKISGDWTYECTSNQSGLYHSGYYNNYIFRNKNDRVYYEFTAYYTPYFPADEQTKTLNGYFDYASATNASDEYDKVSKTYSMTIPTNEDGTK